MGSLLTSSQGSTNVIENSTNPILGILKNLNIQQKNEGTEEPEDSKIKNTTEE